MNCVLLVLAVSLDALVASIAFGSKKIDIPFLSTMVINIISSLLLTLSIFLGFQLKRILPGDIASIISFVILFLIGIFYLFESIIKAYLESKASPNKEIRFKLSNIRFMINIYIDETLADLDYSKTLDSKEAIYLGTALSLDSLTIGFGSGLSDINYLFMIGLSLLIGMISVRLGLFIGKKLASKSKVNLSWLAGIILIFLAISRLF